MAAMRYILRQCLSALLCRRNLMVVAITTVGLLYMLVTHGGFAMDSDATTQVLPFIYETKRMLAGGAPWWSWNSFLGDNFVGSYAYYTAFNPFHLLVCLLPYRYIYVGFTLCLYLKLLVCAWITDLYMRRMGFSRRLCLMGCLLYTFSGWTLTNLVFYIFLEPMMALPLMLLAIERFLRCDSHPYTGLMAATALTVVASYYFAPSNLIVSAIYLVVRLCVPSGGAVGSCRRVVVTLLRAGACVAVGLLLAAPLLLPVAMQILGSPRLGHQVPVGGLLFQLDRLVAMLLPRTSMWGSGFVLLDWTGGSYVMNVAVFGLLPAYLALRDRRGHWCTWLLAILLVCYLVPVLNNAFALYTNPGYSRWSYAITLCTVLALMYYLRDCRRLPRRPVVWYAALCLALYVVLAAVTLWWHAAHPGAVGVVRRVALNGVMLAVSLGALYLISGRPLDQPRWARVCLWAVCGVLAVDFALTSIDNTPPDGVGRHMRQAMAHVADSDMSAPMTARYDYASDSVMLSHPNLHMLSNRATTRSYHSVQNGRSTYQVLGMSQSSNFINYDPGINRQSFDALMSVRGVVTFNDYVDTVAATLPVDSVLLRDDMLTVHAYRHYIPMGYAYDSYTTTDRVLGLYDLPRRPDIPRGMLNTLVISPDDTARVSGLLAPAPFDMTLPLDSLVRARRAWVCDSVCGTTRGLWATIALDRPMVVFFSVPDDPGFTATIDGAPTDIIDANLGLMAVVVPAGHHTIELTYFPPGLVAGLWLMLAALLVQTAVFVFIEARNR